jgi:prepilin-type N-terminal cleavage/methylation domain-containing protein
MNFINRRAFSLIELSVAMAVMAVLSSSIVPIAIRSLQIKAAEKTALEMAMIQDASRNYYTDHSFWPADIAALKNQSYLNSTWTAQNPWKNPYQVTSTSKQFTVSTQVPSQWANAVASHLAATNIIDNGALKEVTSSIVTSDGLDSVPVGSIMPWASASIPEGFLLCNGQMVNVSSYPALFSLLGTTYGGDGINTFGIPDTRGRTIVGQDNMGGIAANRIASWPQAGVLGGAFGEERHRLTVTEMPKHHHGYMATPWTGSAYDGHSSPLMTQQVQSQTDDTGGDQPHNIVQPSIALIYIIKY